MKQNFLLVCLLFWCCIGVNKWVSVSVCVRVCVRKFISLMGPILCLPLTSVTTVPIPLNVVSCMVETNHYACGHSDSFTGKDGGYCSGMKRERQSLWITCLKTAVIIGVSDLRIHAHHDVYKYYNCCHITLFCCYFFNVLPQVKMW